MEHGGNPKTLSKTLYRTPGRAMLPTSLALDSLADDEKSSSPTLQRRGRRGIYRPTPLIERHRKMILNDGKTSKLYHGSHRRLSKGRKSLQEATRHDQPRPGDGDDVLNPFVTGALHALFHDNAEDDARMSVVSEDKNVRLGTSCV
ncbi:hypothetical protein SCHPADRAFT_754610 [Schizopora paradoxa]|uniref:Uncharacterized protein n=1 Tax=Schizopora paradoxa TaxID=27342 RepID=A0A0H2R4R8_9AGAM|nr:hypothetical protein SCHPADRAFT_754610 [Schizopora paradoxa]